MLGGHAGIALELLVNVDDGSGEDGKEGTEAEDDNVTDCLGKRRVTPEVRRLTGVLREGRDERVLQPLDDEIGRHLGSGVWLWGLYSCVLGELVL